MLRSLQEPFLEVTRDSLFQKTKKKAWDSLFSSIEGINDFENNWVM
jgi:hypothetical protein